MQAHPFFFVLYLLALICFGLATFGVPVRRVNLIAAGLFLALLPTVLALAQG